MAIVSGLCDLARMKRTPVQRYLAEIGRKGGLRSRRTLDPRTARRMVALREARRAYRSYYHTCFWSYQPNAAIQTKDIGWVVEGLKKKAIATPTNGLAASPPWPQLNAPTPPTPCARVHPAPDSPHANRPRQFCRLVHRSRHRRHHQHLAASAQSSRGNPVRRSRRAR